MENDFAEMGYAKLDTDRKRRTGFAEVVFCSGKSVEQLVSIYRRIYDTEGEVLGTRASKEQYEEVRRILPAVSYDAASRILKIEKPDKERIGKTAVCTAKVLPIFRWRRRRRRPRNFSGRAWNGSTMWESADCTGFYPGWIRSGLQTV